MNLQGVITDTVNKAAENIQLNDGDYIGEDGFYYCGKCNTRKQGEYKMPWGNVRTQILCKCAEEERDRKAAEHAREQQMFDERERLSFLRSNGLPLEANIREIAKMICPEAKKELERMCFPESAMRNWTFENDDKANPKIIDAMKKYVEIFPEMKEQGQGFLLFGEVGTGKTYAAVAAANALLDKGYSVLVTKFTRIANTVGGMHNKQEYYDKLNCFDLLVLDDLGAERKTEYMQEIVWDVIDNRYRAGLPMIITTNLTSDELKKPQEISYKRIYDRAMERCLPVEVTGKNRRHQNTAANFTDLKARFGL